VRLFLFQVRLFCPCSNSNPHIAPPKTTALHHELDKDEEEEEGCSCKLYNHHNWIHRRKKTCLAISSGLNPRSLALNTSTLCQYPLGYEPVVCVSELDVMKRLVKDSPQKKKKKILGLFAKNIRPFANLNIWKEQRAQEPESLESNNKISYFCKNISYCIP